MRSPRTEFGAGTVLFAASGAVAVAIASANVLMLAHAVESARLRDLRLLAHGRAWIDAHVPALLAYQPGFLHVPFELGRAWSDVTFLAAAVAVHLALAWTCATLAAPLVVPLARRRAPAGAPWPHGYPLGVVAAASLPIVTHRLGLWSDASPGVIAAASVAAVGGVWLIAMRVLRRTAVARTVVRISVLVAGGGALLATLVGLLAVVRAPHRDGGTATAAPGAPNVVLISIDTLRPDHLGSYGYQRDTSPTLDALAAAGARFTTVVSPTSWTLPAHATLLTALPPEIHGVVNDGLRLDEHIVTLAHVLRRHGYATAGFVSGPYLDAGYGFARGFDHYDDYTAMRISRPAVHQAHTSPALLASVVAWLDGWQATVPRRPFCLFVHMWDVHYDFNPPPPYDTMFDPDYAGAVNGDDFEKGSAVHVGMDARDLAHVVALYDGEIRYADAYVGRLVDALRAARLLDDTVVVVTADHGEEFYEHGRKGHRFALYDESIRVPLIIRYPARVPAGTVVEPQVRLVDVAPTILALAGVVSPADFGLDPLLDPYAGRSLLPLLAGETVPPLPAFASLQPQAQSAIRHEHRKLIQTPFESVTDHLFDLTNDPGERTNLAAGDSAATERLKAALEQWALTASVAAKRARTAAMSDDHTSALRALGYIE